MTTSDFLLILIHLQNLGFLWTVVHFSMIDFFTLRGSLILAWIFILLWFTLGLWSCLGRVAHFVTLGYSRLKLLSSYKFNKLRWFTMVCLAAYTSCFIFNCWFSFNVWFTLTTRFYSWYDSLLLLIFYDWLIPAIYKTIRYADFHCVYFNNGTLRSNIIHLVFDSLFI